MDQDCNVCGRDYTVREGMDPTPTCDECAHATVEALRRLWPLLERSMKGYVFTAAKAGEVAADMAALRRAVEA